MDCLTYSIPEMYAFIYITGGNSLKVTALDMFQKKKKIGSHPPNKKLGMSLLNV